MKVEPEYKVGDQVKWSRHERHGYTDHCGEVTKISDKGTLHVRCANGEERKIMRSRSQYGRRYDCDLMTPYQVAENEWSSRRPKTTIARVHRGWGYRESDDRITVSIAGLSGRDDISAEDSKEKFSQHLRTASAQLAELAAWWDSRPSRADFEPKEDE